MDTKPPTTLSGPQFSLETFRRFEPHLRVILEHFNRHEPLTFNPHPLACETYCSRIRDAIRAVIHNTHWTTTLDRQQLYNLRRDWIFSNRQPLIYCGPPQRRKPLGQPVQSLNPTISISQDEIDAQDEEILFALCILKNNNLIMQPIVVCNLTTEQKNKINEKFKNVELEHLEPLKTLLI